MKMTSKKIYQVGFVILLLINATLIFLLVKKSPEAPINHESREGAIIEKISSQLELTEDQIATYQSMAIQHRERMRILGAEHQQLLKSYFETLNDDSPDAARIKSELLEIESKKLQHTYTHFQELKSTLNESQKVRFELIIKDISAVLTGERNNRPPPPRDKDKSHVNN
jgi:acyl-ACP thioesterase